MGTPDLELVRAIADDLPVGVWVAKVPTGELLYANRTFAEIMGQGGRDDVAVGEYAGPYGIYGDDGRLYPEERMPFVRAVRAREIVVADDIVIWRRDGRRIPVRAHARPIFDAGGEISHVVIAFFDRSREAEADARLRHAEKMQSIGQLAGGIAHDFNNVLAAVRVLASRLRLDERDPRRAELLDDLDAAAESGARLAKQLLVLGGTGRASAAPFDVVGLARRVTTLLERTLDRRIVMRFEGDEALIVRGDESRVEQLVMNLAFNARDAIAGTGGTIVVRARRVEMDERTAERLGRASGGPHACIEVSDTGPGIPEPIRARIFEPYFTTKTTGEDRGTGLGLATVYGVVEAHRGSIEVLDAEPHGALVRVWLPLDERTGVESRERAPRASIAPRGATGMVLFVDDEEALRRACESALECSATRWSPPPRARRRSARCATARARSRRCCSTS